VGEFAVLSAGRRVHLLVHLKVAASQTSAVFKVDDKGAVAKEGIRSLHEGSKGIRVFGRKGVLGNLSILAAEVTDLASGGLGGVARRLVAAVGRVKMALGRGAVAILGSGDVNVVSYQSQYIMLGKKE
jgi:hypothetical protein